MEAHQKLGLDLPVNLKFVFEGMEESGSEGLDETVFAWKDKPFMQVGSVICRGVVVGVCRKRCERGCSV